MWFGAEVITHNEEGSDGEFVYDTCVVIHITEATNEVGGKLFIAIGARGQNLKPLEKPHVVTELP